MIRPRIGCILLAAGRSSRMKGPNKLLLKYRESSLIQHTVTELQKVELTEVVVVTGHQSDRIKAELADASVKIVYNPDYLSGMHSSIRKGLLSLEESNDAVFICLADQPDFDHEILDLLIEGFKRSPPSSLIFPTFRGKKGHPVLISSHYRTEILEHTDGDFGCAYLLKDHPDQLVGIPVESEGVLLDVDEPKDLERYGGLHAP